MNFALTLGAVGSVLAEDGHPGQAPRNRQQSRDVRTKPLRTGYETKRVSASVRYADSSIACRLARWQRALSAPERIRMLRQVRQAWGRRHTTSWAVVNS